MCSLVILLVALRTKYVTNNTPTFIHLQHRCCGGWVATVLCGAPLPAGGGIPHRSRRDALLLSSPFSPSPSPSPSSFLFFPPVLPFSTYKQIILVRCPKKSILFSFSSFPLSLCCKGDLEVMSYEKNLPSARKWTSPTNGRFATPIRKDRVRS